MGVCVALIGLCTITICFLSRRRYPLKKHGVLNVILPSTPVRVMPNLHRPSVPRAVEEATRIDVVEELVMEASQNGSHVLLAETPTAIAVEDIPDSPTEIANATALDAPGYAPGTDMLPALTTAGMASKSSSEAPLPSASSGITDCEGEAQWLSQVLGTTLDDTPCSIALRTPASLRNGSLGSECLPIGRHRAPLARGQAPVAHHVRVAYNVNILKARGAETQMTQSCASPHRAPPSPELTPAARTLISDWGTRQAARRDVIANPHTQAMLSAWAQRQTGRQSD